MYFPVESVITVIIYTVHSDKTVFSSVPLQSDSGSIESLAQYLVTTRFPQQHGLR
jgi:hypothetical protein